MRRMQIEEMQLSEEFVEQFSEILLKEFWFRLPTNDSFVHEEYKLSRFF